jgi:uncharacterized protein YjbI with pentapeptide repeats
MSLFGLSIEDWRNLALIVATGIGLPVAIWRSWVAHKQVRLTHEQVRLAEAGQNADRYQKGAAMLGDKRLPVREAGIFALSAMANRDPDNYYVVVQKLFCSFIRDRSREQMEAFEKQHKESDDTGKKITPDVQTALKEFSYLFRDASSIRFEWQYTECDLKDTNLRNADLQFAFLHKANLRETKLCEADLCKAHLQETNLQRADLQRANLQRANLQRANLQRANLDGADLEGANLQRANLQGANLEGADLEGADLQDANLDGAKYGETALYGAKNVDPKYLEKPETDD